MEQFPFVPPDRHRARPRAARAFTAPTTILEAFECPSDGHSAIEPTQLARDGHGGSTPVGYFGQTRRSKRAACEQKAKSLEKVRFALRSEERRVGKECRSRWSPY